MVKYGTDLVLVTNAMKEELRSAGVKKSALKGKVLLNVRTMDLCRLCAGCYGSKYYFSASENERPNIRRGVARWENRTGRDVMDLLK